MHSHSKYATVRRGSVGTWGRWGQQQEQLAREGLRLQKSDPPVACRGSEVVWVAAPGTRFPEHPCGTRVLLARGGEDGAGDAVAVPSPGRCPLARCPSRREDAVLPKVSSAALGRRLRAGLGSLWGVWGRWLGDGHVASCSDAGESSPELGASALGRVWVPKQSLIL